MPMLNPAITRVSNEATKLFEDFQKNCQQKWREYLLSHDGYEVEYRSVSHFKGELDMTSCGKRGLRFPSSFGYGHVEYTDDFINRMKKSDPINFSCESVEDYAHVYNPQYAAMLFRGGEAGKWRITNLDVVTEQFTWDDLQFRIRDEQPAEIRQHNFYDILSYFAPGLSLTMRDQVAWMVRWPHFQVVSVETVVEDGVTLLKIAYKIDVDEETQMKYRMTPSSGTLTFFPETWVLKRAEYVERTILHTSEFCYDTQKDSFPLLTKLVRTVTPTKEEYDWAHDYVCDYDIHPLQDESDRCFRLSSYGLPEPDFESDRSML
ncbi:MAG: hypothetical protein ACRC46_01730 [Thermoguttaceae bacterium]